MTILLNLDFKSLRMAPPPWPPGDTAIQLDDSDLPLMEKSEVSADMDYAIVIPKALETYEITKLNSTVDMKLYSVSHDQGQAEYVTGLYVEKLCNHTWVANNLDGANRQYTGPNFPSNKEYTFLIDFGGQVCSFTTAHPSTYGGALTKGWIARTTAECVRDWFKEMNRDIAASKNSKNVPTVTYGPLRKVRIIGISYNHPARVFVPILGFTP
ncbi:hypothetical protein CC2G_006539 [Coprinopsis cinerea AmutBmut pab1-1]|nr:hypothetical protein CC2G_006539 [Coprinopsis cinerea AmutBmut pab1-1]